MVKVTARDIVARARAQRWAPAELNRYFTSISLALCDSLLQGSAIITEADTDGSYTLYQPSVLKGNTYVTGSL